MKSTFLKLSKSASLNNLQKVALFFTIVFALEFTTIFNADAQRRGPRAAGIHRGESEHNEFLERGYNNHWDRPVYRYSYFPGWEAYDWYSPFFPVSFFYRGLYYYWWDGIYYQYHNGNYEMSPAPVGYRVRHLPDGYTQLTVNGSQYYYYNGSFYAPEGKKYEVVTAPVGAIVGDIPRGAEKLEIDGQTFYSVNGTQFKAILKDNAVWYQVVKNQKNETNSSVSH